LLIDGEQRFMMTIKLGALALALALTIAAMLIPKSVAQVSLATPQGKEQVAVFAGGCFWGIEAVFEHVRGVRDVTVGYSGGAAQTASYELVSGGRTGHAESVRIIYDPSQVSYEQLLKVFFYVAHDPTELNRQGPDMGTQYRSVIFYTDAEQKRLAQGYIEQLNRAKAFNGPIVTEVVPLDSFYQAEAYHQDYAVHHPDAPYIVVNDAPKVMNLRDRFPDLYAAK
jgi:peptide-methionine (S)-S-oxide reductase